MFTVEFLKKDQSAPVGRVGFYEYLSEARIAMLGVYHRPPGSIRFMDTLRILDDSGTEIERLVAGTLL